MQGDDWFGTNFSAPGPAPGLDKADGAHTFASPANSKPSLGRTTAAAGASIRKHPRSLDQQCSAPALWHFEDDQDRNQIRSKTCTQNPGDLMLLPAQWGHATYNPGFVIGSVSIWLPACLWTLFVLFPD